ACMRIGNLKALCAPASAGAYLLEPRRTLRLQTHAVPLKGWLKRAERAAIALEVHVRVGIEDNIWRRKGERMTTVQQPYRGRRCPAGRGHQRGDSAARAAALWRHTPWRASCGAYTPHG